jgi:hypothetical protein
MSITSVSSYGNEREYEQQRVKFQQSEQRQQRKQYQLLESINRHKERVITASHNVEMLECKIRQEMEKLISLATSSFAQSPDDDSPCLDNNNPSSATNSSINQYHHHHHHHIVVNSDNTITINQLEAHILRLENDLLIEQRTLAEYEQLYQDSLKQTKQRWKRQIEEHQRRFRVCYRASPPSSPPSVRPTTNTTTQILEIDVKLRLHNRSKSL